MREITESFANYSHDEGLDISYAQIKTTLLLLITVYLEGLGEGFQSTCQGVSLSMNIMSLFF